MIFKVPRNQLDRLNIFIGNSLFLFLPFLFLNISSRITFFLPNSEKKNFFLPHKSFSLLVFFSSVNFTFSFHRSTIFRKLFIWRLVCRKSFQLYILTTIFERYFDTFQLFTCRIIFRKEIQNHEEKVRWEKRKV